jgi:hypothetical protein
MKNELSEYFTDSPVGLAGTAAGLVAGGWAAEKAQEHYAIEKKGHRSTFLTLLGAAVGGLAINHVIDKYEEKKRDRREKEERYGGGDRRGKDRDRGRGYDEIQDSREFPHSYEDRY